MRLSLPGAAPIDDNAYTCGCHCDAAPVTKTVTIVANTDDAEQDGANVRLGGNDLHIGPDFVGLRFVNVGLPKDATIVSAAVQFTASATDIDPATVAIVAQADSNAATFSSTANDISNRPPTVASVPWSPGPWNNNEKGPAELTPDLSPLLAELVSRADWSGKSPVVLRFNAGTGQRRAVSFSNDPAHAAALQVTFSAPLSVDVPVCATPDIVAQNVDHVLPPAVADADCHGRVTDNLKALGAACGYPTASCTCSLVTPDQGDATFDRDVCKGATCSAVPVDAMCSNFDPNGFWDCLQQRRHRGELRALHRGQQRGRRRVGLPRDRSRARHGGAAVREPQHLRRQRVEPHPGRRPRAQARSAHHRHRGHHRRSVPGRRAAPSAHPSDSRWRRSRSRSTSPPIPRSST